MGPLLILGLLGGLAPTGAVSHGTLGVSLDGGSWTLGSERSWNLGGGGSFTLYPRPVVDDEAPLSLQSFLQRRTSVSFQAGLGGFSTSAPSLSVSRNDLHTTTGVGVDAYLTPNLILGAGVALEEDELQPGAPPFSNVQSILLSVAVDLGLRVDDFRADLVYRVLPEWVDGTLQPIQWGSLAIDLRYVAARRADLSLSVGTLVGGFTASGGLRYWFTRSLGLLVDGFGSNGQVYLNSTATYTRLGGQIGIAGWFTPRIGGSLTLQLTGTKTSSPGSSTIVEPHAFASLFVRFR